MMQARQRFAIFEQAQDFAATEIVGIGKLKFSVGRGIAFEQLADMGFEAPPMANIGMIQEHYTHGFLLGLGFCEICYGNALGAENGS